MGGGKESYIDLGRPRRKPKLEPVHWSLQGGLIAKFDEELRAPGKDAAIAALRCLRSRSLERGRIPADTIRGS